MAALVLRMRGHLRNSRGLLLLLAVLVTIVGSVVMIAAAGARRTKSAPDRFVEKTRVSDVFVDLGDGSFRGAREIEALPGVAFSGRLANMAVAAEGVEEYLPMLASVDGRAGWTFETGVLLEGRRARRDAPGEVALSERSARRLGAGVGDVVRFASMSPERYACFAGEPACPMEWDGPPVSLQVVGIVRLANDLVATEESLVFSVLPPAFFEQHRRDIGFDAVLQVGLDEGTSLARFARRAREAVPAGVEPTFESDRGAPVRDEADVGASALWVFAGVVAVAGLVMTGQAIARHCAAADDDRAALVAMGMRRRDRVADRVAPLVPVAIVSGLLAVTVAYLASGTMPIGDARLAEPDPGPRFDAPVLLTGAVLVPLLVVVTALVTAWRRDRGANARPRRSWAAMRVARLGAPVATVTGLGMAFDRGHGRASTAARSALAGGAAGMAGVVAVLAFGASLGRLLDTPSLYGWGNIDVADLDTRNLAALQRIDGVDAVGHATLQADLTVDGAPVPGMAVTPIVGDVTPSIASGRLPSRDDEIALGHDTLAATHRDIGDTVHVAGTRRGHDFVVVGTAVFPSTTDGFAIADGALVTGAALETLGAGDSWEMLVARVRPGADREAVVRRIARLESSIPGDDGFALPQPPAEVDKLRQVDRLPRLLAIVLAVLGATATGHALFLGVRRRGRELAVLRVLGCSRAQVRSAVAWQALAVAVVAAAIGVPLGVVVGRLAWSTTAGTLGVVQEMAPPTTALWLVVPAAIAVAMVLALLPARRAVRLHPATVLRSE
jgi:hypothetical protein